MLDDFFVRALVAGVGVALLTGPLGCVVVWRRLAYFGDTLAHAGLLGVALGLLLELEPMLGVFLTSATVALALLAFRRQQLIGADALLGLLSHSALALGIVVLAFMTWVRVDLMSYLFGDILAVSVLDIAVIYSGGALVLTLLALLWRPLVAATVDRDLAAAEGQSPLRSDLVFTLLLATVVAVAMKVVGVLLVTALLVIPAAAARRRARSPEHMALIAAALGVVAVIAGLNASLSLDTPAGPSIVVAALALFLLLHLPLPIGARATS